jgi:NAD(P)-dependent dehydrogenase (short-subunit alcohol dehydrogenase family)
VQTTHVVQSPAELFDLTGKVAVVSGASSGIGVEFAQTLRAAGATVIAVGRRKDRLEALAAARPGVIPFQCDVTVEAEAAAMIGSVIRGHGRIDILVNNAGTTANMPAEDESLQEFRRVSDLNVTAVFHLSQLAGRAMLGQGAGSIVNIASILGFVAGSPIKQASYCASKGAILSLTRELAVQWAARGVRVNAIAPGYFPSELTQGLFATEKGQRYIERNAPLGRGGRAGELAGALLLLASDAGSYITGQTIVVDGGWIAH